MCERQEKKRRQIMRQFLSHIMAVDVSQQFKSKEKFILNLPEKLFILKTFSSEPVCPLNESENSDIGLLADLFKDPD